MLNRRSTSDHVVEHLRRQITEGTLLPGERITEVEIAATLHVSRSPIREALHTLSEEGLVTIIPYRGAIVAKLTRDRFEQLLRFRLALEEFAIECVINVASDDEIKGFRTHIKDVRETARSGSLSECSAASLRAHEYLIALAKNIFLEETYGRMINLMRMYVRATSIHYKNSHELADEHQAIFEALLERDLGRARALLREHIIHGFNETVNELEG
ncbi:MAG TPA: GntR family transcriptional regulator [Candidatus Baltobacteraceae bacterium]|nr:GntR family transcriptional regulator [Candidatus Baltobacteraceae bacterium]